MSDLAARVAAHELWYHTMDLGDGVVTPGWFDLRPVVDRLPWPDVAGRRCLDVGTYDGFLAFELERRGAAEVVAIDIESHHDWDWLPRDREAGIAYLEAVAGRKGRGFEIAAEALGSSVRREWRSVYDLDPNETGTFDVVVCGALLLHLRDPFRALAAIRGVCAGPFLSVEQVDARLGWTSRRPALVLQGNTGQWAVPSPRGHRRMLEMSGFDVVRATRPFRAPYGPSHPPVRGRRGLPLAAALGVVAV